MEMKLKPGSSKNIFIEYVYSMHRFKQDILNYGMLNNMLIHFKSSSSEDWLGHDSGAWKSEALLAYCIQARSVQKCMLSQKNESQISMHKGFK